MCLLLCLRSAKTQSSPFLSLQKWSSNERQGSFRQDVCKNQREIADFLKLVLEAEKKKTILGRNIALTSAPTPQQGAMLSNNSKRAETRREEGCQLCEGWCLAPRLPSAPAQDWYMWHKKQDRVSAICRTHCLLRSTRKYVARLRPVCSEQNSHSHLKPWVSMFVAVLCTCSSEQHAQWIWRDLW